MNPQPSVGIPATLYVLADERDRAQNEPTIHLRPGRAAPEEPAREPVICAYASIAHARAAGSPDARIYEVGGAPCVVDEDGCARLVQVTVLGRVA
jgi:hypothetical protein